MLYFKGRFFGFLVKTYKMPILKVVFRVMRLWNGQFNIEISFELSIKWDQERNGIFINHETKYR